MSLLDDLTGIEYPDRAEGLSRYSDYKVFVDFWQPLTDHLAEQFRILRRRGQTKVLGIYGEQGSGKTLFSKQLLEDHRSTKSAIDGVLSSENVWQKVAAGAGVSPRSIQVVTADSVCGIIPDSTGWIEAVKQWRGRKTDTSIVAVADNAETDYFLRGLVDDRFDSADRTNTSLLKTAAEQLVKEARREDTDTEQGLTGMLLIMLSNDRAFLEAFKTQMDSQHRGMMQVLNLPLPDAAQKERAVRVNVNRLNEVSYWYCLDKGGDEHRRQVRSRLVGATTFPDTFDAVDQALKFGSARTGRPGRKNLLTLVCLSNADLIHEADYKISEDYAVEAHHGWVGSFLFNSGWALPGGLADREARLLESEWQLRIVALGNPFVSALLDQGVASRPDSEDAKIRKLLRVLQKPLGPTSLTTTREKYEQDLKSLVDNWVADIGTTSETLHEFWDRGQNRSNVYEPKIESLLGIYNRSTTGFLKARPDVVVNDFKPAALTESPDDSREAIIRAIQRNANAMEFTSQKDVSPSKLGKYLSEKLPNYLAATTEQ